MTHVSPPQSQRADLAHLVVMWVVMNGDASSTPAAWLVNDGLMCLRYRPRPESASPPDVRYII